MRALSPNPVRLGDPIDCGKLLWCYCCDCGHERDLDPRALPLPPDLAVPLVRHCMTCSRCGSRKIDTKPELCPGGVVAKRERMRRAHEQRRGRA